MKKRFLPFSMVLALTFVMAMPMAASAVEDTTTTVTGTVAGPTIGDLVPNSGVQGNTIPVVINGTGLAGATSVSFGDGITVVIEINVDAEIDVTITIAANATPGVRNVTVITPDGQGTLTNGFTVLQAPYITVTAPSDISLGTMSRTIPNKVQGNDCTVATNAENWEVQVTGAASNGGFMAAGANHPTAIFQIGKNGTVWTDADQILTYTQDDTISFDFWVQQVIDADDPAGNYSITLTFTGSMQ